MGTPSSPYDLRQLSEILVEKPCWDPCSSSPAGCVPPSAGHSHVAPGALEENLPSGYVKIAIENGHFIVDFPIKIGDFP